MERFKNLEDVKSIIESINRFEDFIRNKLKKISEIDNYYRGIGENLDKIFFENDLISIRYFIDKHSYDTDYIDLELDWLILEDEDLKNEILKRKDYRVGLAKEAEKRVLEKKIEKELEEYNRLKSKFEGNNKNPHRN